MAKILETRELRKNEKIVNRNTGFTKQGNRIHKIFGIQGMMTWWQDSQTEKKKKSFWDLSSEQSKSCVTGSPVKQPCFEVRGRIQPPIFPKTRSIPNLMEHFLKMCRPVYTKDLSLSGRDQSTRAANEWQGHLSSTARAVGPDQFGERCWQECHLSRTRPDK